MKTIQIDIRKSEPNDAALNSAMKEDITKMHSYIADNLVGELLQMGTRSKNRHSNQRSMRYENFGDFYRHMSPMFIVSFSKSEMLIESVIELYIKSQLSALVTNSHKEDPNASAATFEFLHRCISENIGKLSSVLRKKWPTQYKDLLRRNTDSPLSAATFDSPLSTTC